MWLYAQLFHYTVKKKLLMKLLLHFQAFGIKLKFIRIFHNKKISKYLIDDFS